MGSENAVAQIAELEHRIADLKARLPKHSVPPAMLIELEELEKELEQVTQENSQ
jgi:hypothetical protein